VSALLIVGVVIAVPVLYAADRVIKARSQARRKAAMSERLAVAAARGEKQHERRQQAAKASAALTSVMPAINRPPLTLPADPAQAPPANGEPAQAPQADSEPAQAPRADGEPAHPDAGHEDQRCGSAAHTAGHGPARPRTGCGRTAEQDHTHLLRASRTGEHMVRSPGHS
jgi:hypothetical protein